VVLSHHLAQHFRVRALAERRRAHEVAEHDRHRLAYIGLPFVGQRRAASSAEPEADRILLAAGRTGHR
jgi:hypothetical protein